MWIMYWMIVFYFVVIDSGRRSFRDVCLKFLVDFVWKIYWMVLILWYDFLLCIELVIVIIY